MTTVRELAEQFKQKHGIPIVIMATQDFDLGDVTYPGIALYDRYPGDIADYLSELTNQKIILYVACPDGRLIYSEDPHYGAIDRMDFVEKSWSDRGRFEDLLKSFGIKLHEQYSERSKEVAVIVDGTEQDAGVGDGVKHEYAVFYFDEPTGQFKNFYTGT